MMAVRISTLPFTTTAIPFITAIPFTQITSKRRIL